MYVYAYVLYEHVGMMYAGGCRIIIIIIIIITILYIYNYEYVRYWLVVCIHMDTSYYYMGILIPARSRVV